MAERGGGVGEGSRFQGGSTDMNWGVYASPIPTGSTHLVKHGQCHIRDVVEGEHLRVQQEDSQMDPPRVGSGLPMKR